MARIVDVLLAQVDVDNMSERLDFPGKPSGHHRRQGMQRREGGFLLQGMTVEFLGV